ncbi:MAG: FG-GAP repeat protein, partial [Verrucomicrobia bacterium]|nr:FG-GAP repeat protein [Verrucomicrobiota bacterium]
GDYAYGVWGDGSFIYLANYSGGLHTYSLDGSGNLTHIDSHDQGGFAAGVWGGDSFIYLANGDDGLHTYALEISDIQIGDANADIHVQGGLSGDGSGLSGVVPADNSVTSAKIAGGAVTAEKLAGDPVIYGLTTITNPTPEVYDYFGRSVAGVGGDKFLVGVPDDDQGATNAGVAHLYRADGTFLMTVTNPTPAASDRFGFSIAGVGSDKFIVGAHLDDQGATDAGVVHLYQNDGTFLMTLTNPTPDVDDDFGVSVAGVGSDKFIVGAYRDDQGATDAGVAHLYHADGTFLMTLTNPIPAASEHFGYSVAGVGRDKFLIGAHGVAHLYQADGAFLMTITNPLAGGLFGYSVAGVGSDKFIVGARDASVGGYGSGAAYLYQSDGTFLMTLTNPTPAESDSFGCSVAGVGSDKFIVGASDDDQGAGDAGVVHLYRNDGAFLMTITNPTPAGNDWFGISVAGVGSDKFIVGAYADNQGATDAGVAHLYSLGIVMDGLIVRGENIENGTIVNADLAPNAVGTLNIQDDAVSTSHLEGGAVTAEKLAGDPVIYGLTTITNPTPEVYDYFGRSVAGVGGDKFLVGVPEDDQGATNAGVAHLYRADGTFLLTVTNPTPAASDRFGISIAGVGSDKFIVGANLDDQGAADAGAAHLYQADGTFLMTLTNPTPAADDYFGFSTAGVGSDKFIVGAHGDDQGAADAGVVHLYRSDGTFLMTLTNPTPAASDRFGYSVAGVGRDKFLVGAHGVAHLYQADGAFLMTITNPTPLAGSAFGYSVAGVGSDKFVVGALDASLGGYGYGAAYLYQSDGTFLMTLTNPTPAESDGFGGSVAGVGSDKFIVGASNDDQGAGGAGVAHLYRNDGVFLMTITNPTPASSDWFGISVAGVGGDKFIVGAYADNQGATDAGVAHLYSLGTVMDGLIVRGENIENGTIVNADLAPNAVGTLNIQDDAVTSAKIADGAIVDADVSGSANIQPSKIAGTAATLSGNQEFDSGTLFIDAVNNRIGIGTNSPEAQLHIVGGWSWTSPDIRIETPGYEHTRIIQAPNGLLLRNYHASNSATAYSFRNANDEKLLTVNANSRIGVATDAPKNDLQVWGDAMFGKGFTPDATANSSNIINILSGTGSNGWANGMTFYESTSGFGMSLGYDGTGAGDENSLRIYDSDRNALVTFKNGGRVGIGTTTPAGKLDVNGAIYQRGGVLHADYVFEPEYALESIEDHAAFMWEHKHLGAMPPREVDEDGREVVEVGSHRRGLVEELEKAHIYIEQLKRENEEIREQFTHEKQELNQRLEALELRLEREGL